MDESKRLELETSSNRQEASLLENNVYLSRVVNLIAESIVSVDEELKIVHFNKGAEKTFGYRSDEAIGMPLEMLIPERFREAHGEHIRRFIASENSSQRAGRRGFIYGLGKDGEEFPAETSISKFQMGSGLILTAFFHDISQTKKAEGELRKFSRIVEQADESIIVANRKGVIEYVNPAFTRISGYSAEEVIGKTPTILRSGAQDESFYKQFWETIGSGESWKGSVVDRCKDGTYYPTLLSVSPIHDELGVINHYVGIQQDLTEYKRLEEQFLQAQKMDAMGTLVGGIAHDFNNMLAAIHGNVYLAKLKLNDKEVVSKKLQEIEQLSMQAAEMVRQLLTFARKDTVCMSSFSFTSFMKEGFKLAESAIPENIKRQCHICSEELIIKGDATQLQQALINLLNNARDAVADVSHPKIVCSLRRYVASDKFAKEHPDLAGEQYAHLSVSDNGYGITKDRLNKVFEPFFTTKESGKGTGLGLAMVYGAVKTHAGHVEVESEVGEGTTFHIYLPLNEKSTETEFEMEMVTAEGHGETVLLADDEESVRKVTSEVLKNMGYRVLEARDGEEAWLLFESNRDDISLIITDIVMPKLGGVDLANHVREQLHDIPIIFITGYDKEKSLRLKSGIDQSIVLMKPFSIEKLSQSIQILIEAK